MADKYLSAAGKRRRLYINTFEAFNELMADICRQKTSSDYFCHPTVILSVVRDRGKVMHMIIMITIAAYTFTKITFAIINLVRLRKGSSAKLIALRNISLADSCVSIFALQRSMLVSFPGMAADDIRIMNAVFGSAICIIVFLLGYNLIRNEKFWFKSIK